MSKGTTSSIVNAIKTPLGALLMIIVTLILAGLSVANSVSGDLTAAAIAAAGMFVIVLILAMINMIGK